MIYPQILQKCKLQEKQLAVLIDPDKQDEDSLVSLLNILDDSLIVNYIFVGGSLINNSVDDVVLKIRKLSKIPVVLFPGSPLQISTNANSILFLSLISGRNPDFLIGNHVVSAPFIKKSGIEVIPTGYILIDGGKCTSVEYMSNTRPIPADKSDIAIATAIAGEMLGNKLIYMDAGSGAQFSISPEIVKGVRANVEIPIIIGGGIRDTKTIFRMWNAGADIVVLGSVIEKKPEILLELQEDLKSEKLRT